MMAGENVKDVRSWGNFLEAVEEIDSGFARDSDVGGYVSNLLFRGQASSHWKLESTLDRFLARTRPGNARMSVEDYNRILLAAHPAFASYTNVKFDLAQPGTQQHSDEFERVPWHFPGYSFAIYLRHHQFPSPLLDWTRSPYVAAFFAFNGAVPEGQVSIYCFREHAGNAKAGWGDRPRINGHGPYAITHDRHYRQQAEYTTCTVDLKKDAFFACHEDADFGQEQDILYKINIPSFERAKAMKSLDQMNINAFSLFGSHEGLADMLAYREIERN